MEQKSGRSACLACLFSLMLLGCVVEGVPGVHPTENPISAAEDRILILEGKGNMIFVATSMTHNGRSVWQQVDFDGNFGIYYVYWFKDDGVWNVDFHLFEYPRLNRLAYGYPIKGGPFPEDGMGMYFYNPEGEDKAIRGILNVASADVWTTCRPHNYKKLSSKSQQPKAYGRSSKLSECTRRAVADDRHTTGVMVTKGECFAFNAHDVDTECSESVEDLACTIGLVLLPGMAKAEKTYPISRQSPIVDVGLCVVLVQIMVPMANGMTFNEETLECEALIGMRGVHSADPGKWKSAFFITRGKGPTPTPTDIPEPTETSTTTEGTSQTTAETTESQTTAETTESPLPDITTTTEGSATTRHDVVPIVHIHKHHMSNIVLVAIVAGAVAGLALLIAAALGLYSALGSSRRPHQVNLHEVEAQRGRMEVPRDRELEATPSASLYL